MIDMPLTEPCPYPSCSDAHQVMNALTDNTVYGSELGVPIQSAIWASGDYLHVHGWVMYPPSEDRLRRHIGRAVRSRLPGKILRLESLFWSKWRTGRMLRIELAIRDRVKNYKEKA